MATTTTLKVTGLDASYYTVKDLARATKFYQDLFGFEPTLAVPDTVAEWTFGTGETFGIYKSPSGEWHPAHGLLFHVDDVQSAVELCKSKGIKLEDGGKIEETPVCHMAFAEDTEGNHFIIHKRK
jgi:predicted enzyme related to lactoylglutathione lyase